MCVSVLGYLIFEGTPNDLIDEVYDCGDFLIVKKREVEECIPLINIMNVNFAMYQNPARITLSLARPGKFEPQDSFTLPPP